MGNIVLLDDLTINKIAAGEVIERPANVVKELAENAIDAGANKICIEIKNGGKTFIRVTDNGKGILEEDMPLAFERHATSKIRKIEDLEKVYSMGFRGEAVASISSVSKFTMITKTKNDILGHKMVVQGEHVLEREDVGAPQGTTIIVEELFYNTPVRFKFLKQDAAEFRYIKELVQNMALANLNVAFELINDSKTVFRSVGNNSIKDLIYILYGKDLKDNVIDVNYNSGNIEITGVIGNTFIARDNRKDQIFFLNGRNIKNPILTNSTDQAFKGSIGIGKYGFAILNIKMPADYYDVNVHPTKRDVRFKNEDEVYKAVYHAIKSTMLNKEFLGDNQIEINSEKEKYVSNELSFVTNNLASNEILKNENETVEEAITRENKRKVEYKYLGILLRTYIIVEIKDELYLIDQHAAHERILYEQIKENYKKNIQNNTQMMLVPQVVNLSHKELQFVNENLEMFKNIGFELEPFGNNSIKVNGIPDLEYKANKNDLFLDILDEMISNERTQVKDVEERFIATVACKAAVKAHMDLDREEVDYLITTLLSLKNPYTCPHGRPTTIKVSKEEIMKKLS